VAEQGQLAAEREPKRVWQWAAWAALPLQLAAGTMPDSCPSGRYGRRLRQRLCERREWRRRPGNEASARLVHRPGQLRSPHGLADDGEAVLV
jgi:hypothetical protein